MRFLGFFLVIISAVSFGLMPIFATFAYKNGLDVKTILLFRFLIAAILLNIYVLFTKQRYPTSVSLIGSSLTSILLYLYPSIVLILSTVLLKTKVHKSDVLALILTTVGAVLVVGLKFEHINFTGMIFGISAALIYSIYIIVGTKALDGTSPLIATAVIMASSAIAYSIYGISTHINIPVTIEQWGWVSAIVLISTIIASITFFAGLKLIGPLKASMISTFELVVTLFCSYLILDEKMREPQIFGSVFILVAALILAKEKNDE